MRVMILEKDSSVLGYPGETSKALDADHHSVCKYDSPEDPNYVAVRNILKSVVSKIISASDKSTRNKNASSSRRDSRDLHAILDITELPMTDYSYFRDQWAHGTCDWILHEEAFAEWRHPPSASGHRLLWLNGGPASGKSVMSSFIVNQLVEDGERCQYFYIRYGDQKKRTISLLLRSIAYQIAQCMPEFMERVIGLGDEAIKFETTDSRIIWMRIFKSILFDMEEEVQPLFWVIDGLDEADDPRGIIKLLCDISSSRVPIRILLVGRKSPEMEIYFQRIPGVFCLTTVSIDGRQHDDLCRYVHDELNVPGTAEFRDEIARQILDKAQANFLWVRLAVDKVNLCHRQVDVEAALQHIPAGMEELYDRMAAMIVEIQAPADKQLAFTILQYTTCALRALTVSELTQALGDDTSGVLDLKRSIIDLCGGFIVIDTAGTVNMIHQTAREYLKHSAKKLITIDRSAGNEDLFTSCMKSLMMIGLRAKISKNQAPEFLDYAATSWSLHLLSARMGRRNTAQTLKKFLTGVWVLTWIEYLADTSQLRVLVQTSKNLSKYASKLKSQGMAPVDEAQLMEELELFQSWAIDLVKVAGKFGMPLRRNPKSIYKLVPPFCPPNSSIYQLFGVPETKSIAVSGLSAQTWDDLAGRIPLGDGMFASSITIAGNHIFVLVSQGTILVYDSSTFEEINSSPIMHREHVTMIHANKTANLLVTYGYRTTKVWETSSGVCKTTIANLLSRPRPLVMQFTRNSTMLLVGFDDKRLRLVDLKADSATWEIAADLDEPELDGHFLNASNYMAMNEDASLVAVAYRGHPLSAWETEGPMHIGHCWRKRNPTARGEVIQGMWLPQSSEFLGLYIEGVVFKWNPYENEVEEALIGANRLALNRDGSLFATGDGKGTVRIFVTASFGLLYQLSSQDPVLDISFGPGSHRFYDIRGSYVNVWEPNSLMSFAENNGMASFDSDSETESISVSTMTASFQRIDAIMAIATMENNRLFFSGTENGVVRMHDTQRGLLSNVHTSGSFLGIEQLCCSSDGRHLFFCDLGRKVTIMTVTTSAAHGGKDNPTVEIKAKLSIKDEGSILGLLCHSDATKLLVQAPSSLHVICIESRTVSHSLPQPSAVEMKWIQHPHDASLVVGFAPNYVLVLDWSLKERGRYMYDTFSRASENSGDGSPDNKEIRVNQVLASRDKKHILVNVSHKSSRQRESILLDFETTSIDLSEAKNLPSETPTLVSPQILALDKVPGVRKPLAYLLGNRHAFLSQTYSVCTWQLPSGPTKELFSLPGDWINKDCLDLCTVWEKERAFLCPRNGEVAVVKCAALA